MTIFTSLALVVAIIVMAAAVAYYAQKGQLPMKDLLEDPTKQVVDAIDTVQQPPKPVAKKRKYYPKKPKTHI